MKHVTVSVKNNPLNATQLKSTHQPHVNAYVKTMQRKLGVYNKAKIGMKTLVGVHAQNIPEQLVLLATFLMIKKLVFVKEYST